MSLIVIQEKDGGNAVAIVRENVDFFEESKNGHIAINFNNGVKKVFKADFWEVVKMFQSMGDVINKDPWDTDEWK